MDLPESYYVETHCPGQVEVTLPDRTRVDCLTNTHAIEFDWCKKWAESIGQALYYAKVTNKEPMITLICKRSEFRFIDRVTKAAPEIALEIIYLD